MNDSQRLLRLAGGPVAVVLMSAAAFLSVGCNRLLGIHDPIVDAGSDAPPGGDGADTADDDRGDVPSGDREGRDGDAGDGDGDVGSDGDGNDDVSGDGDGAPPPPLTITTAALPDGYYNAPYAVTFTASGGSGAERSWMVTSGGLPHGLDLHGSGVLDGLPVQEGPFAIDVTVSEMPPGTGTATAHFTFTVRRKYWLVFRASSPDAPTSFALYAVDVRNPAAQILVSSNISSTSGMVDEFAFSPDGRWLAYLAYQVVGYDQLYVVDMNGAVPGAPRPVNEYGSVRHFAWSPDSSSLAFSDEGDQGIDILVADMTRPAHPARGAAGVGTVEGLGFVTDDLLTYWFNTLAFTRRSPGGDFGTPQVLTPSAGGLVQRWPELQSGLFASAGESCQDPTWALIDFHDPLTLRTLTGYVSVSPGRDYVAHRENPDDAYLIYPTWGTDPIAMFPTASHYCAPGSWSHDGTMFVSPGDDDTLQVTHVAAGTATTGALAGSYGTVAENGPPRFSPDDSWLAFSTNQGAYVVRNDGGALGPAVGGGVPVTASFAEPRLAFAPNSLFLASGEADSAGRPASVRLIDLRQDPLTPMDLPIGTQAGNAVNSLAWSAHSTELALLVRERPFPSVTNLYLCTVPPSNLVAGGATMKVTVLDICDSNGVCPRVSDFAFQP